jgi:HEAT repeat protein
MVSFFCPCCWRKVSEKDATCSWCGGDIRTADAQPFSEKLRAALRHREPQTRVRVAWILGELRECAAVEDLMALVVVEEDGFVAEAAAEALGKIGAPEAVAVLEEAEEQGTVRVRLAARKALEQIRLAHGSCMKRGK